MKFLDTWGFLDLIGAVFWPGSHIHKNMNHMFSRIYTCLHPRVATASVDFYGFVQETFDGSTHVASIKGIRNWFAQCSETDEEEASVCAVQAVPLCKKCETAPPRRVLTCWVSGDNQGFEAMNDSNLF